MKNNLLTTTTSKEIKTWHSCDLCYQDFLGGIQERICPECKKISARQASMRQAESKRRESIKYAPITGFCRVVSSAKDDDLQVGVDIQETSIVDAIKRHYYSRELVLVNASGKMIRASEIMDKNPIKKKTEWEIEIEEKYA